MVWRYTPVLNECLQLTLCAAVGFAAAALQVITPDFRVALQTFVFHIAMPLLVARGVALQVDFYDKDMWAFVGTFLSMRVVALAAAAAVTAILRTRFLCRLNNAVFIFFFSSCSANGGSVQPEEVEDAESSPHRSSAGGGGGGRGGGGGTDHHVMNNTSVASQICELWLGLSWVSTVVVGLPVLTAALGDEFLAVKLGLQAAISSFIFQLPGILLLLEIHAAEPPASTLTTITTIRAATSSTTTTTTSPPSLFSASPPPPPPPPTSSSFSRDGAPNTAAVPAAAPAAASEGGHLLRVLSRMAVNPVFLGILIGVILSVTGAGAWLDPRMHGESNQVYSEYAAFIPGTARLLGQTVTPIGMFVTGAWMCHQHHFRHGNRHRSGGGGGHRRRLHIHHVQTSTPRDASSRRRQFRWSAVGEGGSGGGEGVGGGDGGLPETTTGGGRGSIGRTLGTLSTLAAKLVLVPLVTLSLAHKLGGLNERETHGAVLLASLPVSVASVVVSEKFSAPTDLVAAQVIGGVALLLPTTLAWCHVLGV